MHNPSQKAVSQAAREREAIRVFFTDERFLIDGIAYPDIPMFVDAATLRHLFLPSEWMVDLAVLDGHCESPLTWKAYAYDLRGFLEFLDGRGYDWRTLDDEMQIGHYGVTLAKAGVSQNTVNRVISTVCRFYEWAHRRGSITTLSLSYDAVKMTQHGFLAHIQDEHKLSARAVVVPRKYRRERLPRFFTVEERKTILKALNERDQLITLWSLFTGAREHEICALDVDQIPPQHQYRSRPLYRLKLRKTKRGVPGELFVPTWLLDRTYQHIALYDRKLVRRAAEKRGKIVSDRIFLSAIGNDLKPDSVYNLFKAALVNRGIQGTFHDLRHTYAITMLDRLMKAADRIPGRDLRNPLLILRHLLRHASLATTQKYLVARDFYLTDIFSDAWELPELTDEEIPA